MILGYKYERSFIFGFTTNGMWGFLFKKLNWFIRMPLLPGTMGYHCTIVWVLGYCASLPSLPVRVYWGLNFIKEYPDSLPVIFNVLQSFYKVLMVFN